LGSKRLMPEPHQSLFRLHELQRTEQNKTKQNKRKFQIIKYIRIEMHQHIVK
jgi:hypothetical protein